jgi:two-component system phosphate regulon sensor histidine kinase PhoR
MKQDSDASVFDLNPLFDEVMVLLDDEAVAKHVTMITSEGEEISEPFMVKANRYRIKQILINLIENAIKYNVDNGKVYISAERSSTDEVVLKVRDTGYGIAKEHLPRIFERFYRVDKSRSKELGGTGLGLSIVKHIAMLYGGNASAESTVGQGSEFTVTLKI